MVPSRTVEVLSTSRMESGSVISGMIYMSLSLALSSYTIVGGPPVTDTVTSGCQVFGESFEASIWPSSIFLKLALLTSKLGL